MGRAGIYIMAPAGRRRRRRWRAREKDRHTFAGSRRGARREVVGKKWTERDLDAPRRSDEDEALRYIVAGATEKGARRWSASRHRCLAVPCAGAGRVDTDEEVRRSRRREKFAESRGRLGTRLPASAVVASCDYAASQLRARRTVTL